MHQSPTEQKQTSIYELVSNPVHDGEGKATVYTCVGYHVCAYHTIHSSGSNGWQHLHVEDGTPHEPTDDIFLPHEEHPHATHGHNNDDDDQPSSTIVGETSMMIAWMMVLSTSLKALKPWPKKMKHHHQSAIAVFRTRHVLLPPL